MLAALRPVKCDGGRGDAALLHPALRTVYVLAKVRGHAIVVVFPHECGTSSRRSLPARRPPADTAHRDALRPAAWLSIVARVPFDLATTTPGPTGRTAASRDGQRGQPARPDHGAGDAVPRAAHQDARGSGGADRAAADAARCRAAAAALHPVGRRQAPAPRRRQRRLDAPVRAPPLPHTHRLGASPRAA